jgi:hypothetical protein
VFPVRYGLNSYILYKGILALNSRVEAGSNTCTVSLRVLGGDEKKSLESETVKYGHASNGTWTRE